MAVNPTAVKQKKDAVEASPEPQITPGNASRRAILIGSVASLATAYLVTQAEMVISSIKIGFLQFPPAAFGMLLLITLLSRGLHKLYKKWQLSSSDLIVIYCMCLISAMVSSHGIVEKWIPLLVAPGYFANSANNWHSLFNPFIQQRLVPFDVNDPNKQAVLQDYFSKVPRGSAIPWGAWILPLLNWGILIVLVLTAFLCLTAILRKQWVDNEKLAFPLAQLPLEIAADQETGGFFSNGFMWLGASIPIVVFGIKGLHHIYPTMPDIPLDISISQYLTTAPYNALSYTEIAISFAAIGFFFLLPTDVTFSIWFFFILTRLEELAAISYNMDMPAMPIYPPKLFVGYQTVGAYVALVGYFLWIARPHLATVWAAAVGKKKVDDSQEVLPYRFAVWGLIGCILASSIWLWTMGMSLWLALGELVCFLGITAVVMTRCTAEAGLLMTETTFRPIDIYRMVAPIHALGHQNLTMLAFFDNLFLRDQRGLVMTGMLDSMRMSDGAKIKRRSFVGIIALGAILSLIIATWANIYLPYHIGAARMDPWMEQQSPQQTFSDYQPYFQIGSPIAAASQWQMPTFFTVGVVVTVFLSAMRTAFFWWPLHPLGYALSGSWATVDFWFSCMIAWALKSLTLRYGGMKSYTKLRPFFLGMVVGEFGMAVLFVLLNILFKFPPPEFPWD